MKCPNCQTENLKKQIFYQTEVDYCPRCLGIWFEEGELLQAKDEKDSNLNWLDIDLWKERGKFKISKLRKVCPVCSVPLYGVDYGNSGIEVDICNVCRGVFLDRGEFKKIIEYLKVKGQYEVLRSYFKNLAEEGIEVFMGPEEFKQELSDFLTLLKLLNYKLVVQYPKISKIILSLPR